MTFRRHVLPSRRLSGRSKSYAPALENKDVACQRLWPQPQWALWFCRRWLVPFHCLLEISLCFELLVLHWLQSCLCRNCMLTAVTAHLWWWWRHFKIMGQLCSWTLSSSFLFKKEISSKTCCTPGRILYSGQGNICLSFETETQFNEILA